MDSILIDSKNDPRAQSSKLKAVFCVLYCEEFSPIGIEKDVIKTMEKATDEVKIPNSIPLVDIYFVCHFPPVH